MTSHHPTKHTLALTLALAALASAALADAGAAAGNAAGSHQSGVQIIRVSAHGFNWGDAGIGAAAGIGFSMLAVGGGLLITGTRHSRGTTAAEAISPAAGSLLTPTSGAQARVPIDEQERR